MHVLIVDNRPYNRITTKLLLRQIPCVLRISEAGNNHEAIAFLAQNKPDLILIDVMTHEFDGFEATRQIKNCLPDARIIALAYADQLAEEALAAGADKFILKKGDSLPLIKEIIRACESQKSFYDQFNYF